MAARTANGGLLAEHTPIAGKAQDSSPLANVAGARPMSEFSYAPGDDLDDNDVGPSVQQLEGAGLHRTASSGSKPGLSRKNTLTKNTLSRKSSLKRSGSKKSLSAGSLRGVQMDDKKARNDEYNSVFYCPVPTSGSPTEILANRFQAWRKFLKDLIAYFKEVQNSYETKSKALIKVANIVNNTQAPTIFISEGGLNEANRILSDYHRQAVVEANKAREIEDDVITQLAGLRADLGQKIKEIKSLSGDFKNSVDKEKEHTKKAVNGLQDALALIERDDTALTGKEDPYIIRLGVERQIERQLDEENYLHRAYLNLEGSGRELESIVVGEVQKAYNALAGILKREADESYNAVDALRSGPITIPKDLEWSHFIDNDPHFISADTPLRKIENIEYPGKDHPATVEVRAGMLERKSKYLKSYTPGWYVLSPTHLHEFKSADHIYSQSPVMSLLLSDQKLGSHSQPGASSHKFMLKGRQTGSMHRGHSWVFRAETYDTMLAWYDDIRALTEKTGEERNAFIRKHARSFSAGSHKAPSVSGDSAFDDDEADNVPFSKESLNRTGVAEEKTAVKRPEPGGRFPSDLDIHRHIRSTLTQSSGSEPEHQDITTAAGGLQLPAPVAYTSETTERNEYAPPVATLLPIPTSQGPPQTPPARAYQHPAPTSSYTQTVHAPPPITTPAPLSSSAAAPDQASNLPPLQGPFLGEQPSNFNRQIPYNNGSLAATVPAAAMGAMGAVGAEEYWHNKRKEAEDRQVHQEIAAADTGKTPVLADLRAPASEHVVYAAVEHPPQTPLTVSGRSDRATSDGVHSEVSQSTAATELTDSPLASKTDHTAYDTNPDGSINAAPTGQIFPAVLRHNTDTSVSNLHVPGEYPKFAT